MIIGNQADDESKREVNQVEGEEMAKSLYLPFLEISAKNLSQVEEAFFTVIREISYRLEQDVSPQTLFPSESLCSFRSFAYSPSLPETTSTEGRMVGEEVRNSKDLEEPVVRPGGS